VQLFGDEYLICTVTGLTCLQCPRSNSKYS